MQHSFKLALYAITMLAGGAVRAQNTVPIGSLYATDHVVTPAGLAAAALVSAGQALTNSVQDGYLCTVQTAYQIAASKATPADITTAMQAAALVYVPYAGALKGVDLGTKGLTVGSVVVGSDMTVAGSTTLEGGTTLGGGASVAGGIELTGATRRIGGLAALPLAGLAESTRAASGATVAAAVGYAYSPTNKPTADDVGAVSANDTRYLAVITNEVDLAVKRLEQYGDSEIVESPAEWFNFEGGLVSIRWQNQEDIVVVPWEHDGVEVTYIDMGGAWELQNKHIWFPKTFKAVYDYSLSLNPRLETVYFGGVTSFGKQAFERCSNLVSVTFAGDAPSAPADIFDGCPNVTNYVMSSTATGWGDTFGGRPVVRLPLFTGSGGNVATTGALARVEGLIPSIEGLATTQQVAEAVASVPAPAWIGITNLTADVTVTNINERPVYLYATGDVALAFADLRAPLPLYLVVRGADSLAFPAGTHFVGGGSYQTNQANHFVVWSYGTNLFVNPVTTSED